MRYELWLGIEGPVLRGALRRYLLCHWVHLLCDSLDVGCAGPVHGGLLL
jgi:hypothetical protein